MLHRAIEDVAHLDAIELRVLVAYRLGDRASRLAVRRSQRLVERQRRLRRPHLDRLGDVFRRDSEALGELCHRRLAAKLVLHLLVDANRGLVQLLQAARKADRGALVSEVPLDLAGDRERRERGELEAEVGVEALDGLDQAEVADLDDVVERLAAVLELAR